MQTRQLLLFKPNMAAAIEVLKKLILDRYPGAMFTTGIGQERAVFVTATVDVDDTDEVVDLFIDRVLALQSEQGLRLHVIPVSTPARRDRMLAEMRNHSHQER